MKRNIVVEQGKQVPPAAREVEVVERKGLGHPDTLTDGVMEEISKELSKAYINDFGKILHHNVDKGQICAGATRVEFGGGIFTKPIFVLLSGRATTEADGRQIPVQHIARQAAHDYLQRMVKGLDVENDVEIDSRISAGSPDLVDLFLRGPEVPFANDTSFCIGTAPRSELEQIVLETERHLNSAAYKKSHPEVGVDIKVMGLRQGDKIRITAAVAFVSKHVKDMNGYEKSKERVKKDMLKVAKKLTQKEVEVFVNNADNPKGKSPGSVYLTLTGTSAEMGDDGSVGRGNRANGLITPMRAMSLEAVAGKNPVNHVGKVYSVLANELAMKIAEENPVAEDVTVTLLSQIGKPIDQPKIASVSIVAPKEEYDKVAESARYLTAGALEEITEMTNRIVFGKVPIF